jgi:hypothetical protein
MTRSSILYTRSQGFVFTDMAIRAWDAGHMSHVGVCYCNRVIDASLWHGVAEWHRDDWLQGRIVVDELPVFATDEQSAIKARDILMGRIGQRYDLWEILGYPLLRDLGDPERPVCSRLGYDHLNDACSLRIPGRQGRIGPRLLHAIHHAYNLGMLYGPQPRRPATDNAS